MTRLAILLTCFNRKAKTLSCLKSIYAQKGMEDKDITIFLVDDNSSDGTREAIASEYPAVRITKGSGDLFWAGGMRAAWGEAMKHEKGFDFYLLLNDDTTLYDNSISSLFADYALVPESPAIMVGSTKDPVSGNFSYGGRLLTNRYNSNAIILEPDGRKPQLCHLGNANIMLVPKAVVEKIGILSDDYTHGIADYDYTMAAKKAGIPSYIGSIYGGTCTDDHGKNWKTTDHSLKKRIQYLYSPKGLSYKEYLVYIRKFFPLYLPQAWLLLWVKTFFPFIWELKKK